MRLLILMLFPFMVLAQTYPTDWFKAVPESEAESWEILPQHAKEGEVILSKRTELGIFSNFAATPFEFENKVFASVEGLWQSMKFPDPNLPEDQRQTIPGWIYTRSEVEAMVAFEAKEAGTIANAIYKKHKLKNVTWNEMAFDYKDHGSGSAIHLHVIRGALRAKLDQTPGLWDLLLKTRCLKLLPDHRPGENDPPSYRYYEIFMEFRAEKLPEVCP